MPGWLRTDARVAAIVWLVAAFTQCSDISPPLRPSPTTAGVLVGAGDIGWCGLPGARGTATLLDSISGTVFTTGDNAYPDGTAENFRDCYHPFWGRQLERTRPTPGNHDYNSPGAGPYFDYFGARAGPRGQGYYSFDVGSWHVIALNSNIISIDAGTEQVRWLQADLAANPVRCTLAYWHHPLFASGPQGPNPRMSAAWRALYESSADVVLNGDDHAYERFAPQDPNGRPDPSRGIRQFTVGTGGAPLYQAVRIMPNSEVRSATWGVLKLTLEPDAYGWEFLPVAGESFRDAGSWLCH